MQCASLATQASNTRALQPLEYVWIFLKNFQGLKSARFFQLERGSTVAMQFLNHVTTMRSHAVIFLFSPKYSVLGHISNTEIYRDIKENPEVSACQLQWTEKLGGRATLLTKGAEPPS